MLTFPSIHDQELMRVASTQAKFVSNSNFIHSDSLHGGSFWFGGSWEKIIILQVSKYNLTEFITSWKIPYSPLVAISVNIHAGARIARALE